MLLLADFCLVCEEKGIKVLEVILRELGRLLGLRPCGGFQLEAGTDSCVVALFQWSGVGRFLLPSVSCVCVEL